MDLTAGADESGAVCLDGEELSQVFDGVHREPERQKAAAQVDEEKYWVVEGW
jgi:hypothetical protein